MKNFTRVLMKGIIAGLLLFSGHQVSAQIIFTSSPDSVAILNEIYSYDVQATFAPDAPTFSLQAAPSWMSINASSGIITGTPTSMSQGGRVVVKAHNTFMDNFQIFYVYITDEVVCDPAIVSYWPMDAKDGIKLPDVANNHDANYYGTVEPIPTISSTAVAGNSILFDPTNADDEFYGVTDQAPFKLNPGEQFSVSFWFKNTPSAYSTDYGGEVLLGRNTTTDYAKWYLFWNPVTEKLQFNVEDNSTDDTLVVNPTVIDDEEWHHVVAAFNNVAGENDCYLWLFVDKVPSSVQFDYFTGKFDGAGELNIGWMNQWGRSYSGYLDEVVYYNKELLPADVTALYNKGVAHQPICSSGNIAPLIYTTAVTQASEDVAYSYQLKYRELNPETVTLSAPVLPSWLTFNTSTGVLSGTPSDAQIGLHNVTLRANDGHVSVDQVFTISVSNVNDLPVISSTAVTSATEDAGYSYTVVATDADAGSSMTFTAPVLPSWLSFNSGTHQLSGTPTNDQVGHNASADFPVTLRVTDNNSGYTEQSFTVTVHQVNDAPVVNGQSSLSTDEDTELRLQPEDLTVSDVDNDYPADFTATVQNGSNYTFSEMNITPAANWNGILTVPVILSDGTANVTYNISITVNAVNDAPVFTSEGIVAANVNEEYQYWITSSDAESQGLTLNCTEKPSWLVFSSNAGNGLLTGTPSEADKGGWDVTITVTDGLEVTTQTFNISVTGASAIGETEGRFADVHPNPASDFVEFEFSNTLETANLKIITLNGKIVKDINISHRSSYTLNVTDLKSNAYIYMITTPTDVQRGKLLVK